MSLVSGNVVPLDPDQKGVGKTVADLTSALSTVLDEYAGHITNAEAIGALEIVKHNTLELSRGED